MAEEHVLDLLPGYALEILDQEDFLVVARHLPRCRTCQQELRTFTETVDQLAYAAPLHPEPPELKNRVLSRVEGESRRVAAAGPEAASNPRGSWLDRASSGIRGLFGPRPQLALSVLALVLLLFLAINNLLLWQQVNELQARLPAENVRIVQLQGTDQAPQASGYVMVFDDTTNGSLTVRNAPTLAEDQQYQIWLIKDGQRTSGGVFSVDEDGYGTLQVTSAQPLDSFDAFGITIEPAGGSPGPTGPRVLGGSL